MAGVDGVTTHDEENSKFVGFVGPGTSVTSVATAITTTVHKIPVVSYAGSSMELSDKTRFPYFLRTWPPGSHQAAAIVDVLLRFKWSYVGLVYSRNTYGIHGAQEIEKLADTHNICLAFSVPLPETVEKRDIDIVMEKILIFQKAKVVIFFVHPAKSGIEVLQSLMKTIPDHPGLIIVSGDSFVSYLNYYGVANVTRGSVGIRSYYKEVPGFREHIQTVQMEGMPVSPWFEWLQNYQVSTNPKCQNITQCPLYCYDGYCNDHYVVDAVSLYASALDKVLNQICNGNVNCLIKEMSGPLLISYLKNTSFQGVDGLFTFDVHGHPGAKYDLTMLQYLNGSHREVNIGFWDSRSENNNHLDMTLDDLPWPEGHTSPPISVCRETCLPGYISVPLVTKCCYGCQRCPINTIVVNDTECRPCVNFFWPNVNYTRCERIAPLSTEWQSALTCSILAFTGLGVVLTSCTGTGLIYYRHHLLIKATGRELSSANLLGLLLSCLTVIPILIIPTEFSCALSDAMIALCLTLTYAPTLLKVNRIHRIFKGAKKSKKRPKLVSPRQQLFLVSVFTAVQVLIVIVTVIFYPSVPTMIQPSTQEKLVEIYCLFRSGFFASCIYNLLLVLACCYYAFKTRKVPSNYNESKFIAASVYSTLLLGSAAALVYTTAVGVETIKATLSLVVLLNAYLTLGCVYLPKLYAARFIRDLSVLGVRSSSGHAEIGPSSVSDVGSALADNSYSGGPLSISQRRSAVYPEKVKSSDNI
ncbi:metabotropic glutamate receptor 1-like [Patiria miniata]|uniref:G-protein coupled receptors family 3 profile domain-containing protein n=1 Tax=Patiria miniata TaxID=46514 RepID=A0A913Z1I7_PATMI|nr:metabotropic glutamate receptor 1-like [Patiria miniata]